MAKKTTICVYGKHCARRDSEKIHKALKREIKDEDVGDRVELECEKCMGLRSSLCYGYYRES